MKPEEASQAIRDSYIPKMFTALEEALEEAIAALEKQVPKKPIEAISFIYDYAFDATICPTCDERVWACNIYCPDCGQRIDWGNEE